MSDIVPGRRYTAEEVTLMRDDPQLGALALRGFYLRRYEDGSYAFVHYTKAANRARRRGRVDPNPDILGVHDVGSPKELFPTPPVVKRTPQQRVDSLVRRWWEHCRSAGTVPGLSDEQISAILGEDWKTGEREITVEDVRRLASYMLVDAEAKKEAADYKRVVRPSPND